MLKRIPTTRFVDKNGDLRRQPCPLCIAVEEEKHLAYFSSDNEMGDGDHFVILPTKNSKGHKLRYQVVNGLHGYHDDGGYPTPHVAQDGKNLLFQFMLQFGEDFAIMEPDFQSIKDHWHLVATSLEAGEDELLVAKTRRIVIQFVPSKEGREEQ